MNRSCLTRILFCIIWGSSFPSLYASLHNLTICKTPLDQPLFFIDDQHKIDKEIDPLDLARLLKLFDEAEADPQALPDSIEYYVFVENSPHIRLNEGEGDENEQTVLARLYEKATKASYKRSVIVDCEVRKVSKALNFILGGNAGVHKVFEKRKCTLQDFQDDYLCDFFTVTFQDLIDDFNRLYAEMVRFCNHWSDERVIAVFNKRLESLSALFQELKHYFESNQIELSQTIVSLGNRAKGPFDEMSKKNHTLKRYVTTVFSQFLDLWVIHHILLIKDNQSIQRFIVIAGSNHTRNIRQGLQEVDEGYSVISDHFHEKFNDSSFELIKKRVAYFKKKEKDKAVQFYLEGIGLSVAIVSIMIYFAY